MTELLTAAQMRAIEKAAIESGQVTGLELMERAGRGVVEAIFEEWPELAKTSGCAVVLCGPGNNGGDGFVVARLLKEWGWEVEVFLYGDADKLPADAQMNYDRWQELGEVVPLTEKDMRKGGFADLYVDALFGTGLKRGLDGELFKVVRHLSGMDGDDYTDRLVSIDAPFGLCLDSGRVLHQEPLNLWPREFLDGVPAEMRNKVATAGGARALHDRFAWLTVCFDSPKPGHFLAQGPDLCGKLSVKDIGISKQRCRFNGEPYDDAFTLGPKPFRGANRPAFLTLAGAPGRVKDERTWGGLPLYRLPKFKQQHKFSHGHAFILSGGPGKTGAARLAARGGLRIGAGLVTLGVPPAAQMEVAAQVTAIMLQRVEGGEGLSDVLKDERLNALCLGPGLGLERARALVPVALAANRATVLDADALTAFADDPAALFDQLHDNCVLTPHGGEFARLFPDISENLKAVPTKGPAYSKVDATREAAKRAGCVVLFKGSDTVIAAPDGRCAINSAHYERSAPWLATAGSGDVLAGFITGLLARGFAPMQAAETAAWLHVECARHFGPGLIAEDLPEQLPAVFQHLAK
ncbi:bifunctional ADP-dependent NAD(P)H-hydrate dehydratase/NAD(P)H-hydrate epimerase [Ruegeria atlantica]|uniref:Bifunctional NAD(P)H-hydrate repair enzyme n=1 Tax=Ruegeria atlantica TaxID=81569 RepID=A0A0P1E748_9RHOB|nr:bifunctional ADP-dependent NAD(P)H-hydrate dehydratase/NAD(P)H-hydrate epimerase [Ruegeria atlantica]CUH44049.1 Nicotinamide nucleotide repair protein [Ruegeria atlantica]